MECAASAAASVGRALTLKVDSSETAQSQCYFSFAVSELSTFILLKAYYINV